MSLSRTLMTSVLPGILVLLCAPTLSFALGGNKSCASNPNQGYYCGSQCDNLESIFGKNWKDGGSIMASPQNLGRNPNGTCPPGSVRVRQVDKNNGIVMQCVNIEGCAGGSGTLVKICTAVDPNTKSIIYKCAICHNLNTSTGYCNG